MRITKSDLNDLVEYLNKILKTTEGNRFQVGYAYGQPRLERENGAGVDDVSPRGTAREVYNYIDALTLGVEIAQGRK